MMLQVSLTHPLWLFHRWYPGRWQRRCESRRQQEESIWHWPHLRVQVSSSLLIICSDLLERIYDNMKLNNPLLTKKNKLTIAPPLVGPLGSKKCVWANFEEIIRGIERKLEHAQSYVAAELGTEVNLNEKNQLIMKGRFNAKQIQNILKNYLKDYVKCKNCRSYKTALEKDTSTRLYILKCNACGSSNSVSNITKGFHNMSRGERRRM